MKYILLSLLLFMTLFTGCQKSGSVVIHAPIKEVWEYVSDASHAQDWSVVFHHISALKGVKDGEVGSIRRCFRQEDEQGVWWDELTLKTEPYNYRRIFAYNAHGFKEPIFNGAEYYVYQHYEDLGNNKTKLTFATEKVRPSGIIDSLAFIKISAEAERIFKINLENIKEAIEAKRENRPYQPKYSYLPKGSFEWE